MSLVIIISMYCAGQNKDRGEWFSFQHFPKALGLKPLQPLLSMVMFLRLSVRHSGHRLCSCNGHHHPLPLTADKRAVPILLECFLVWICYDMLLAVFIYQIIFRHQHRRSCYHGIVKFNSVQLYSAKFQLRL